MAVVVACGLTGASCGGGDGSDGLGNDSPTPESSSSAGDLEPTGDLEGVVTVVHDPELSEPATAWEEFLAEMDDDGRVSKETALEAFALAYGPIPGVEVRAGEPGAVASMTARSWLSHHLDQLTPEQTEAIRARLESLDADGRPADEWPGVDEDSAGQQEDALGATGVGPIAFAQKAPVEGPRSCWGGPITLANAPGSELYRPLLEGELAELATKLGPLGIPVYLGFGSEGREVLADADPWNADCGQRAVSCTVRLMPKSVADFTADQDNLRSTLLHELMHCYQGARAPVNNVRNSLPWIVEGFATFAQRDVHPEINSFVNGWWALWFNKVETPLTQRSYDAVGFFEHLLAVGADPWVSFETALATTQSVDQFNVFTGDVRLEFEQTWASSVSRQPDRGPAWDDMLPGMPEVVPTLTTVTIFEGTRNVFKTAAFMAILVDVEFDAELVVVNPTAGHGRLGWGTGDEIVLDPLGADMAYCTIAGGCECPSGQTSSVLSDPAAEIEQIPFRFALLALAADPSPGEIAITGMSISEACSKTPPPSDDQTESGAPPWEDNVCELLSDADVAAVFGGRSPTSEEPYETNTVAVDGYGGASCRWKVSVSEHLGLDVFPAADVNIDELAAYDPWERWYSETLAGVGDDGRVQRWNGEASLGVAPGSVGSIVVLQGGIGLRVELTDNFPAEPDGLIAAARVILEGQ